MKTAAVFLFCWLVGFVVSLSPTGYPTQVSYDTRAFTINGTRALLLSGCVHYPRAGTNEWSGILQNTKEAHIDVVQTYLFWDVHQPTGPDDWYFEGSANIWEFLNQCQYWGLFVHLRLGPYVCGEWNLGGIPAWVKDIPGIVWRDYNQPWMDAVAKFLTRFINEAKDRKVFAHQGGPVIMTQIENEYGNVESGFEHPAEYVRWCVSFAQNQTNLEPWIMCQQNDAPDVPNLVNTCNGFYCDNWLPNHFATRKTPAAWTENWPGWFQNWGSPKPHRAVQDVAFSVARWVARGGSHINYYMWYGGTTFGRHTGGPMIVTSYDYDVALDEYGQPHQPKYSHSARLHQVLQQYAWVIVNNDVDPGTTLANNVFLNLYGKPGSSCVAFLSNIDTSDKVTVVTWNGNTYSLPPWSVSIVGGCGANVTFNTATIATYAASTGAANIIAAATSTLPSLNKRWTSVASPIRWRFFTDHVGIWDPTKAVHSSSPLEQVTYTRDTTDYFWYHAMLPSQSAAGTHVLGLKGEDVVYVYVNGFLQGTAVSGQPYSFNINLPAGVGASLDVLTQTVGLQNYGAHYEVINKGIVADSEGRRIVTLDGVDFTPTEGWFHQVGLYGESLHLWNNVNVVTWNPSTSDGLHHPLTWWYAVFATPSGNEPLAVDATGLGKGYLYVNGRGAGRYWNVTAPGNCPPCESITSQCDYRGAYDPNRCTCDCGLPSQQYYHIPRDWLVGEGQYNDLVLIEEVGAWDLSRVDIVARL